MKTILAAMFITLTMNTAVASTVAAPFPPVGQIVHYTNLQTNEDQAAIVTRVDDPSNGLVTLQVFTPRGSFAKEAVPFSEGIKPGHYHNPSHY